MLPCVLIPGQLRAQSQAWIPEQNHGTVSLAYQQLFVEWHTLSDGTKGHPGTITNRTVFLNLDYGLTDRLALNYQLNDRYGAFGNYGHTVWGENTHLIDYAVTVGISRSF